MEWTGSFPTTTGTSMALVPSVRMIRTLVEFNRTLFMPERGETDVEACYSAMLNGGGHFGPFVDIEASGLGV